MNNLLLGNGINIQFGGIAYSSSYIMKRIQYRAKLDAYRKLFGDEITASEIVKLLEDFVIVANKLKNGEYDIYAKDDDTKIAVEDFKARYKDWIIEKPHDVMLEDWFLLVHIFFLNNDELESMRQSAIQGFEQLILDAIYNGGKIQEIYKKMASYRKVNRRFRAYNNIFTLNYDNNIECLTGNAVYHLHGDFSVLANSENENSVIGYIRKKAGKTDIQEGMKHCFCNALLNYSGMLKKKTIDDNYDVNRLADTYAERYKTEEAFRAELEALKISNYSQYQIIMTKIKHPELYMATPYYFDVFSSIEGELDIIGMSPNNDAHIFEAILRNKKITKVTFYYKQLSEREYIENNYPQGLFVCESVDVLWRKLECQQSTQVYNHPMPSMDNVTKFVEVFNLLSQDKISVTTAVQMVRRVSKPEMNRLCRLVKDEIDRRNPTHGSIDEKEFLKESAAISYIGLQEGILPTVVYLICCMNFNSIGAK